MMMRNRQMRPFRLDRPKRGRTRRAITALVNPAIERALAFHRLNHVYDVASRDDGDDRHFVEKALSALHVHVDVREDELDRIPRSGPLVVVANHPFGAIDGMILMAILHRARPDAKVMANFLLARIPELRDMLIQVDPFGSDAARSRNLQPLKDAIRHVRDGGALGSFPAGEVAHFDLHQRAIVDPEWSETIARIARRANAAVLPIYFHGRNSQLFNLLGMIHPRLRTVMLPRELLKKHDSTITMRIGQPIPATRIADFHDDRRLTDYLRMRTYLLSAGLHRRRRHRPSQRREPAPQQTGRPIADPVKPELLAEEVATLPPDRLLLESADQQVYYGTADELPHVLREIGRLREITFREVGEGTGRPLDLDRFDETYLHMFVWRPAGNEIIGAYRLGLTDRIVPKDGLPGLYTWTLFDFSQKLIEQVDPAIELGRSFVRPEYQKNYAPLLNLWKGIGRYAVLHPDYCRMFGPVSISNDYNAVSRWLMVKFVTSTRLAPDLAALCTPRNPLRTRKRGRVIRQLDSIVIKDLDEVNDLITDIEQQHRTVPILLKQYLRLGARLLAFNIDPDFGDALDGLMYVDLRSTDPRILAKYLGREGSVEFLRYHGVEV